MFKSFEKKQDPHRLKPVPPLKAEGPLDVLAILTSQTDRAQLENIFEKAGWRIAFADAIEDAATRPIPIVLYDRDLPGADWRQAVQQLAGNSQHPRKVILASFVADDYLWEEVIHFGGYDILPKPFRESEVLHTMQFAWAAVTKSLPSGQRTR
jgi:DNA-binding response OmpR family regulator